MNRFADASKAPNHTKCSFRPLVQIGDSNPSRPSVRQGHAVKKTTGDGLSGGGGVGLIPETWRPVVEEDKGESHQTCMSALS